MSIDKIAKINTLHVIKYAFKIKASNKEQYYKFMRENNYGFPTRNQLEITDDPQSLISFFSLEIEMRKNILKNARLRLEKDNMYPPEFFAIVMVQCFCIMFVYNLEEIPDDTLFDFLDGFLTGMQCLPNDQKYCTEAFLCFYAKLLKQTTRNYVLSHILKVNNMAIVYGHRFLEYSSFLMSSFNFIFDLIINDEEKNMSDEEKNSIIRQNFDYLQSQISFILKGIDPISVSKSKLTTQLISRLSKLIPLISPENLNFIISVLSLFIQLTDPIDITNESIDKSKENEISNMKLIIKTLRKLIKSSEVVPQHFSYDIPKIEKELTFFKVSNENKSNNIKKNPITFFPINNSTLIFNNFLRNNTVIFSIATLFNNLFVKYDKTFEYLFLICKPKILQGDLNFYILLLLFLNNQNQRIGTIVDTFDDFTGWNILLRDQIFLTYKSIFSYQNINENLDQNLSTNDDLKIILMRDVLFEVIQKIYLVKPSDKLILELINLLQSLIHNYVVFTEFLYLINIKLLDKITFNNEFQIKIVEQISKEILIQQQCLPFIEKNTYDLYFENNINPDNLRELLFSLISEYATKHNFNEMMFKSKKFLMSFFSILFEPSQFSYFFKVTCDIFTYFLQNTSKCFPKFHIVLQSVFQTIKEKIKDRSINSIFFNFILLLQYLLNNSDIHFLQLFVQSQLFEDFNMIVSSLQPSDNTVDIIILTLQIYDSISHVNVVEQSIIPYSALILPIQHIGMNDSIFLQLRSTASYPNPKFTSLENIYVLPLLVFSSFNPNFYKIKKEDAKSLTLKKDYFSVIIEDIGRICEKSFWNSFSIFKSNVLFKLLEMIDNGSIKYKKIVDKVLRLFCIININVSSRQLLYSFTHLFHVFDFLKNDQEWFLSKNLELYMNCFCALFIQRKRTPSSFLHFASETDSISMKSPEIKQFQNGFAISVWILLDVFSEEKNSFSLLLFKGKTTKLSIYLTQNEIWIKYVSNENIIYEQNQNFVFPILEWFNFTITYDKDNGFTPFVNGRKNYSIKADITFTEDFETLHFHGDPDKTTHWIRHGQISLFSIFINPIQNSSNKGNTPIESTIKNVPIDIYKSGLDCASSVASMTNLYGLFSAYKLREEDQQLINYKEDSPIGNATYKGLICNFVASFNQVFESSNGASFITALWSNLNFRYKNGTTEKKFVFWLTRLMEAICINSEFCQIQFVQNNTCNIISYFINQLPKDDLTNDLFNCFFNLLKKIKNSLLQKSLCSEILFNINIIKTIPLKNIAKIFDLWVPFLQLKPYELWGSIVTIPFLIQLHHLFYFDKLDENCKCLHDLENVSHSLCTCIHIVELAHFRFEDAELILRYGVLLKSTPALYLLLKTFENLFLSKKDINPQHLYSLLLSYSSSLFDLADEKARNLIIFLFHCIYDLMKQRNQKNYIAILLHYIYISITMNNNNITNNNPEIIFDDKIKEKQNEIALFFMKYYMERIIIQNNSNESNFNYLNLTLSFFAAIFVNDPEKRNLLALKCSVISSTPEYQIAAAKEIGEITILIIMFYLCFIDKTNSIVPFVSAFLFRKIQNIINAFKIIECFEICYGIDLSQKQNALMINTIPLIIIHSEMDKNSYFELFITKMLTHRKIGEFSWLDRKNQLITKGIANLIAKTDDTAFWWFVKLFSNGFNLNNISFSIIHGCAIQNREWIDLNLAKSILQLLIVIFKESSNVLNPNLVSILLFYMTNVNLNITSYLSQVSQIFNQMPHFNHDPVLLNIGRRNDQSSELFKKSIKTQKIVINAELFESVTKYIDEAFNTVKEKSASLIIDTSTINLMQDFFTIFSKISGTSSRQQLFKTINIKNRKITDYYWRRLVYKLQNERSPFVISSLKDPVRHYKRQSYYDYRFRPSLLTLNNHFDSHSNASRDLDQNGTDTSIQSPTSISSTFMKDDKSKIDDIDSKEDEIWSSPCVRTTITAKINGTFYVFPKGYRFISDEDIQKQLILKGEAVSYIFWRWNLHIENSVEIFMDNNKSYFFTFIGANGFTDFIPKITGISLPNKIFVQTKPSKTELESLGLTEKWLNYKISTFDYLMYLNMLSGRSFLNVSCYPIFPWIIVDYVSPTMNPIFRDFRLPVGALNKQRLENNKERLNSCDETFLDESADATDRSGFLYQTGYSNPFIVTYYLLRLEPFTTLHIALNDGKFDNPNRIFNSLGDSFSMLLEPHSKSFQELVPEFFFLPDFLLNSNKFYFGKTRKGTNIDDVILPRWCNEDPTKFIIRHQMVLETKECSSTIASWIDLIWGFKQSGPEAVDANNTFDYHMYAQYKSSEDDIRTNQIRELVGQVPIQLFDSEHPKRSKHPIPQYPLIPKNFSFNLNNNETQNISNIISLNFSENSFHSINLFTVHKNGTIIQTTFNNTNGNFVNQSITVASNQLITSDPNSIVSFGTNKFACVTSSGSGLFVAQIDSNNAEQIICEEQPHISEVSCIDASGNYVITGGYDTCLVLWKFSYHDKKAYVMSHSVINNETITAVSISSEYGIAASCSKERILYVFRLPRLDLIRGIKLKNNVYKIIITRGNGNILVFSEITIVKSSEISKSLITSDDPNNTQSHEPTQKTKITNKTKSTLIKNFTINGIPLKSNIFDKVITKVQSVVDYKMKDYLIAILGLYEIVLIDAYLLDIKKSIFKSSSPILDFKYQESSNIIIVLIQGNEILFVPFIFHEK